MEFKGIGVIGHMGKQNKNMIKVQEPAVMLSNLFRSVTLLTLYVQK